MYSLERGDTTVNINYAHNFSDWFESIYDQYFERLYRYAFSITKNRELAEDVVSEVFLTIWKTKPDYANIQELSAYLYVSVKNLAVRQVSKNLSDSYYSSDFDEVLQVSDNLSPEDIMVGKELEDVVSKLIENLSPHSRLVFDMSKNKGMKRKEIARELGVSERTIAAHLYQVMKKFKDILTSR